MQDDFLALGLSFADLLGLYPCRGSKYEALRGLVGHPVACSTSLSKLLGSLLPTIGFPP